MTAREDFSPVEWSLLTELPIRIIAAAAGADGTEAMGSINELVTGLTSLSAVAAEYRNNPIVDAVFDDYKRDGQGEADVLNLSQQWVDSLVPDTIERCRQVAALLATKADPIEAAEYKNWILTVAANVAAASSTGGFLGFGGRRISEPEEHLLDQIAAALELAP